MRVYVNMIVKDESLVIERCLEALRPYVEGFYVVDTGSKDGTLDLLQSHDDVQVLERPWVHFGHNRSEAIAWARQELAEVDDAYIFVIDADDLFRPGHEFRWPEDHCDVYLGTWRDHSCSWPRECLFRASLPWRYQWPVHELPTCDGRAHTVGAVRNAYVEVTQDGARRRHEDQRTKYLGDAALLEAYLEEDPGEPRAVFYLAQSYKDAGEVQKAIDTYRWRASIPSGYEEEAWYALYQIGRLAYGLDRWDEARTALLEAYHRRPHRAEPLCELARFHNERKEWADAYLYASAAATLVRPEQDLLLIEESAYTWRPLDQLAISAFYLGRSTQSAKFNQMLLGSNMLPATQRTRVEANLGFTVPYRFTAWDAELMARVWKEITAVRRRLAPIHQAYVGQISTEVMAASLETASFIVALCQARPEPVRLLDLGSGFTSAAFRSEEATLDCVSVDDDPVWMEKTRGFLRSQRLPYEDLVSWNDLGPGTFDVVFHDLGNMQTREETLPEVWKRVRPNGWLVLDDLHMPTYMAAVRKFLDGRPVEVFDARPFTSDKFGRYAWLVRRLP